MDGKKITKAEQRGEWLCLWFEDGTAIRCRATPEDPEHLVGDLFNSEDFPEYEVP